MNVKDEINEQFEKWNQAIRSGRTDNVVECYSQDAILVPTLSKRVRHDHAEIRDYFEHFLRKRPQGRIDEQNIRVYGNIAINSGLYTFVLNENSRQSELAARFTFVYRRDGDDWFIVEHHSSVLP